MQHLKQKEKERIEAERKREEEQKAKEEEIERERVRREEREAAQKLAESYHGIHGGSQEAYVGGSGDLRSNTRSISPDNSQKEKGYLDQT